MALGMCTAGAEASAVLRYVPFHEAEEGACGVLIYRVDAPFPLRAYVDEGAEPEASQVMGDCGLLHVAALHDFRDGQRTPEEEQHERNALGIADRLEEFPVCPR